MKLEICATIIWGWTRRPEQRSSHRHIGLRGKSPINTSVSYVVDRAKRAGANGMKKQLRLSAGVALIEALVSVLIFSIGALGLLALQAVATKNTADATYRSHASYMTNQIIAQMWVDRANIDQYAHLQGGAACSFTGTASASTQLTNWIADGSGVLPGLGSESVQVRVNSPTPDTREVKVTVCWQAPQDAVPHNFAATAVINQ